MPPILVRLNLPGFSSPEPFRLANAQPSLAGLACAVLEEIGGFSKEELEGVRSNLDRVPLTLLGELCAGQLVELGSDAQLEVFLANAGSPRGPAIIEVRPREVSAQVGDADPHGEANGGINQNARGSLQGVHEQEGSCAVPVKQITSPEHGAGACKPASVIQMSQLEGTMASPPPVPAAAPQPQPLVPQDAEVVYSSSPEGRHPNGQLVSAATCPSATWPSPISPAGGPGGNRGGNAPASGGAAFLGNTGPLPGGQGPEGSAGTTAPSTVPAAQAQHSTPNKSSRVRGHHAGHTEGGDSSLPMSGRRPSSASSSRRNPPPDVGHSPPGGHSHGNNSTQDRKGTHEKPYTMQAPIYMRLYNEKDDRRRRLEELRLRQLEQQEEEIRLSAQRALGRSSVDLNKTAPGFDTVRASSPSRQAACTQGPHHSGTRTPPRPRPPLPERQATAPEPREKPRTRRTPHPQPQPTQQNASYEATPSPPYSSVPCDASSIISESKHSQAGSLAHIPSVGSLGGEESYCGEARGPPQSTDGDDSGLHKIIRSQQQRIEFLEGVHQQALRQLRKTREELSVAQQMRLREADKVLQLEQLVSEMQAQRFEGDPQSQMRWEEWLGRSRAILETD
mmetsp:Transcript_51608/g.122809  ORF Transcript_51608/g.122809 Transcript_51608/m.122809 type:complete len:620 (-) Transcript_51608:44-1903(-)